jgi:hypothetical protein
LQEQRTTIGGRGNDFKVAAHNRDLRDMHVITAAVSEKLDG